VRKEITEPSPLKGSIRRNVEGVGLTKESLKFESLEVGLCRQPHKLSAQPAVSQLGLHNMEVHEGFIAEVDAIGRTEPDHLSMVLPH
jgi:hypothetical protein